MKKNFHQSVEQRKEGTITESGDQKSNNKKKKVGGEKGGSSSSAQGKETEGKKNIQNPSTDT